MAQGPAAPNTAAKRTQFIDDGKTLLAGITEATEEQREAQRIQNQLNLADILSKSGVFGNEADQYKAFAQIEIGAELGLKPAESMRAVFFGQSGPDIEIHTRVMLAMRSGRYKFDVVELNHNRCEIQWYRKENGQWDALAPLVTTIDQIKHIEVWEKGKQIKLADKWNYKSWREDMMYAFLQRRAVRRYAPETQGSFVPQPADEEVYEDAGMRTTDKLTPEEHATNTADLFGDEQERVPNLNAVRDKLQELRTLIATEEEQVGLQFRDRKAYLDRVYGSDKLTDRDEDELREILDHVRDMQADAYQIEPDEPPVSDDPAQPRLVDTSEAEQRTEERW